LRLPNAVCWRWGIHLCVFRVGEISLFRRETAMISRFLCGTVFFLFASSTVGQASEIRRVVTGLGADNNAIVLFDSREKLIVGTSGNASLNLWITDASPPSFSFKDAAKKASGLSPPDNGTAFRLVEFPPTTPDDEAKMDPN
jgi:hypothetical protein